MSDTNTDKVQKAYIAYYGRPADPTGLTHWVSQLDSGVTFDVMLQAFGASAEAVNLFGNKTPTETIQTLFQQILGRLPDMGGLAFYVGKLEDGSMTSITIAQNVFDGATGNDAKTVTNKLAVAKAFNLQLDTSAEKAAYAGDAAIVVLRDMLTKVKWSTYVELFDVVTSTSVIASLVATAVESNVPEVQNFVVTASSGNYIISNQANKVLSFKSGVTYTFDLSDASLGAHPLRFSTVIDGTHNSGVEYLTGVIVSGVTLGTGASVSISVTESTPENLYYYCTNHAGMGAAIGVSDVTNLSTDVANTVAQLVYANGVPSSNDIQAIDLIGIRSETDLFI